MHSNVSSRLWVRFNRERRRCYHAHRPDGWVSILRDDAAAMRIKADGLDCGYVSSIWGAYQSRGATLLQCASKQMGFHISIVRDDAAAMHIKADGVSVNCKR